MMQKIKRYLLLLLTIASIIGSLISGFLAFAHWNELSLQDVIDDALNELSLQDAIDDGLNELSLQDAIDDGLVEVDIAGIAEDGRFLQPMLAITVTKQTDSPLTVVIPPGSTLASSSGTADVVTLQKEKITLSEFRQMAKLFAYSLDYRKSFPNLSSRYEITGTINADLEPVLNHIVALQAEHEIASQLAVWRESKNVALVQIGAALGRDFSEYRERVDLILTGDIEIESPPDDFWLSVALLVFSFSLTVVFGGFLSKGSKRDAPPPPDMIPYLTHWLLIAEGGMATVWLAVDQRSGEKVVVKFPRVHSTRVSQKNIKFRFEAEIKHHRNMNHPNIVAFLEAGECIHPHLGHKSAYLIQEFIDGDTIHQLQRKKHYKKFDNYMISNIVDQIVEVLKYIHQKKVIHRDITWKNIMLDHTGQVYLIDFGNATEFYSDTTNELGLPPVGTPLFHAPLELIGNVPARDFYSLAMLIYVMSAGKPIQGLSEREVELDMRQLYQNLNGVPKSVRKALEWRLVGDFKDERSLKIRKKYFPTVRDMMIEAIEKGKIQTKIRIKAKNNPHDDEDEGTQTDLVE